MHTEYLMIKLKKTPEQFRVIFELLLTEQEVCMGESW